MFGFILGAVILGSILARRRKKQDNGAPEETDTGAGATTGGYAFNSKGAALHQQVIYGEDKVGGAVVFDDVSGTNNNFLSRIIAFAGHEIESFEAIYLDNYQVTSFDSSGNVLTVREVDEKGNFISNQDSRYDGLVSIREVLGDHTASLGGSSFANFSSNWTSSHILQGIAHLALTFKYSEDAFPSGIPVVRARIKGKKLFDPRPIDATATVANRRYRILSVGTTDFTLIGAANNTVGTEFTATGQGTGTGTVGIIEWSSNPALALRDYLVDSTYGLNEDEENIDDVAVRTAADVCDEKLADTVTDRYTCDGTFLTSKTPAEVVEQLAASMAGTVWYAQGYWRIKAGKYIAPTISFNEDDLRGSLEVSTRHSRRENFNGVRGIFKGPLTNYQPTEYPLVTSSTFVAVDGGEELIADFSTPFTNNADGAQRLANIMLERIRSQITVAGYFGLEAFKVQVGDIVNLTNSRLGFTNKPFEVAEWEFQFTSRLDYNIYLVLREITSGAYDEFVDTTDFETDNTTLPNPFDNTTITSGLTITESGQLKSDGTFFLLANVSWTAPTNPFITRYEVQYKPTSDTVYSTMVVSDTEAQIGPIIEGVSYNVQVRSITNSGVKGPVASATFTGGGDTTAPAAPTNLTASGKWRSAFLQWQNPTDSDLSRIDVYVATQNNSAAASKVAGVSGNQYTYSAMNAGDTRYFFLKAVDYSGNESAFSSGVGATALTTSLVTNEVQADAITESSYIYTTNLGSFFPSNTFYSSLVSRSFTTDAANDPVLITASFAIRRPSGTFPTGTTMDVRITRSGSSTPVYDANSLPVASEGAAWSTSFLMSPFTTASQTYYLEVRVPPVTGLPGTSSIYVQPRSLSISEFKK